MGTDLYRLYDADGVLLYVGISLSAIQRASQHRTEKGWWSRVARMEVKHINGNRREAEQAEQAVIRSERPIHNVIHNTAGQPSSPSGLTWLCEICRLPIANGDGYVELPSREERRFAAEMKQFDEQHPRDDNGWRVLTGDVFILDTPELAHWWAIHRGCDPQISGSGYWIDVSRMRTEKQLLDWTAHLMRKNWFPNTDWDELLDGVTTVSP